MSKSYWRPMPDDEGNFALAGARFLDYMRLSRHQAPERHDDHSVPPEVHERFTAPRSQPGVTAKGRSLIMGIVNATPDSFSDGGDAFGMAKAVARARQLVADGADILDIGGESTRPGAVPVSQAEEIARTLPVIEKLTDELPEVPLSIDTRNAEVALAALAAGAQIFNDVSALTHDAQSVEVAAETGAWVCLMHASADPQIMQSRTHYDDVVLDIYDYLEARIEWAQAQGIQRERLIVDPGIGFGKTVEQNLSLMRNLSMFHGLGVPLLLGASRKSFIGKLTGTPDPKDRLSGSLAVALDAARQGAQIIRVHDVAQTRQALALYEAIRGETATRAPD